MSIIQNKPLIVFLMPLILLSLAYFYWTHNYFKIKKDNHSPMFIFGKQLISVEIKTHHTKIMPANQAVKGLKGYFDSVTQSWMSIDAYKELYSGKDEKSTRAINNQSLQESSDDYTDYKPTELRANEVKGGGRYIRTETLFNEKLSL